MAIGFAFLVLALAATTASSTSETRIVGGTPTSIYDYPFVVSIEYYYPSADLHVQRCVGSLISSWHVLTAAFCFSGADYGNMQIRAGSTASLSGGVVVSIRDVVKHPDYVEDPRVGDIAIVVLSTPLGVTDAINVVYIPPQMTYIPDGYPVKVTSWGFEAYEGPQISTLKTIDSSTVSHAQCEAAYEDSERVIIDDYVICIGAEGKSMCRGDTGAPMIIGETLVGLSSYFGTCDDSTPDVFSRIDRHTGWILEHAVPPTGRSAEGIPVRVRAP